MTAQEKGEAQRTIFDDPVAMAHMGRFFARAYARSLARKARKTAEETRGNPA